MDNRREHFRIGALLRPLRAAEVTPETDLSPLDLLIVNLSGGGMLCKASREVEAGATLLVTFGLGGARPLSVRARVVRASQARWRGRPACMLACEFVELSPAEQDALVGFLFRREVAAALAKKHAGRSS